MSKAYIPDRNHIIWLDYEPIKGKEIGKYRPTLVLSSRIYHQQTGLLIGCPVSTSIRGHITEVALDNLDHPSVVVSNMIHTLDWKIRKAKFIAEAQEDIIVQVLSRLLPLIGAEQLIQSQLNSGNN